MVGQTKEKEITGSMLKVLKMCEDKKIQSVSIPALGTGRRNNIVVSLLKNLKVAFIICYACTVMIKKYTGHQKHKRLCSCTGAGNLGAVEVGNAMLHAITELQKTIGTPSVKTIHIVIFQTKMMKDFDEVMKKFKKLTPKTAG